MREKKRKVGGKQRQDKEKKKKENGKKINKKNKGRPGHRRQGVRTRGGKDKVSACIRVRMHVRVLARVRVRA